MDLTPYVSKLSAELAVAAEAGGQDARALAERLIAPLDSAVQLMLLEALSAAADEITRDYGRPARWNCACAAVNPPSSSPRRPPTIPSAEAPLNPPPGAAPPVIDADDGAMARINVRLPEQLKARIEEAAAKEKTSVNVWLGRAAAAALDSTAAPRPVSRARIGSPAGHRLGPLTKTTVSHIHHLT